MRNRTILMISLLLFSGWFAISLAAQVAVIDPPERLFELKRGVDQPPAEARTVIRNTGDVDLTVGKLESSCGCSSAKVTPEVIPPGGAGGLVAVLQAGAFEVDRAVVIKAPANDTKLQFIIMVDWIEPIEITPRFGVLNFGRIPAGQPGAITARVVRNLDGPPPEFVSAQLNDARFALTPTMEKQDELDTLRLDIQCKPQTIVGFFDESLDVTVKGVPEPIHFRAMGVVEGPLTVKPERIIFTAMRPGGRRTRELVVTPTQTNGATLARVEVEAPLTAVMRSSDNGWIATVDITAPADAGPLAGHVDLVDEQGGVLRVPVSGDVALESADEPKG